MDQQQKLELLGSVELFDNLTKEELQTIASISRDESLPANTTFIEQDDNGQTAYIIAEGSAKVYRVTEDGEEITLSILGIGDIAGEMALLDNEPRSANVETITQTKVLVLTKQDFNKILNENHDVAINLLKTLSKKIRLSSDSMEDTKSKSLMQRTIKTLETLAGHFPNRDITLSQEELAGIIGATRARVTEVLDELKDEGKITLEHRKIHLN